MFRMNFIPVMPRLNHQSLVSHDPSKINPICWFGAQETFIININV